MKHAFGTLTLNTFFLKLLRHDLTPAWRSLSRFKLSLTQCNVPVVFNCMSGHLSGFPSVVLTIFVY